jgi:hypothetical protein
MTNSSRLKIVGGVLAGAAILNDFVTDLLAVCERGKTCALNSRDVNENIRGAIIWLNEAEALGRIEPLYSASVHNDFLS